MILDPTVALRDLVRIPSVNPMGGEGSGPEFGEARLTDHLESLFEAMGLPCQRETVHPGRDNLVVRLDGNPLPGRQGKTVLFGVHQDTVPVAGMTVEPWKAEIRDGRLYGRGACDVKGGMAAMLSALSRLADERPGGMPSVVLVCTVNEEYGFSGAQCLAQRLRQSGRALPDLVVIAEPTNLDVVVAHKGVVRWRCHALGRAGHSANPAAGENAIYKMGRALAILERYQNDVVGALGSHPLCGSATMSVGTIRGGVSVNTIPDRCTIEIDRRLPPGEDPLGARQHLIDYVGEHLGPGVAVEHDPPYMQGPALSDALNGSLARRLVEVARQVVPACRPIGVPYATDAAFLAELGIPTVVFGPGSVEQAHTADEWISLEQLDRAAEIFYRFVRAIGDE